MAKKDWAERVQELMVQYRTTGISDANSLAGCIASTGASQKLVEEWAAGKSDPVGSQAEALEELEFLVALR